MWCTGAATGLLAGGGAAGGGVAGAAGCGSSGGSSAAGGGPSGAAGGIQLQLVAGAPRESAGVWGRQPPVNSGGLGAAAPRSEAGSVQ